MPTINGTSGNEALTGTSEADMLVGLEGDDSCWVRDPFYGGGDVRVPGARDRVA